MIKAVLLLLAVLAALSAGCQRECSCTQAPVGTTTGGEDDSDADTDTDTAAATDPATATAPTLATTRPLLS